MIKDGKAPKKIKVTGRIYEFNETYMGYFREDEERPYCIALGGYEDEINLIANAFNDNIEIIEEEKEIEKLKMYELTAPETEITEGLKLTYKGVTKTFQETRSKINELIDEIKKLKEENKK